MKKLLVMSLVVLLLLLLCRACLPNYVQVTGLYAPHHILQADMPFADNLNAAQFDKVEKLETDSYGRRYYSYRMSPTVFGYSEVEVHVISQKETKTDIYYYPDYCYIARKSTAEAFSEEDIAKLKEWNDWDMPLDEDQMRQIPNDNQKWLIRDGDMEDILRDYFDLGDDYWVVVHYMEINEQGQQMFFCLVGDKTNSLKRISYLLIYQKDESQPIAVIEEIDSSLDCQDVMHNFRLSWFEPE